MRTSVLLLGSAVLVVACSSSPSADPETDTPSSTTTPDTTTSSTTPPTSTAAAPASTTTSVAVEPGRRVPEDHATIQEAVDAADDGDTIVVAPGVWGPVVIDGVDVTLASEFHVSGDRSAIEATVIDGGGGDAAIDIRDTTIATRIIGFTIRNADDGVKTRDAHFEFISNVVTDTNDGIDYESTDAGTSGGLVRDSVFVANGDDGIDLDDAVAVVIEDSVLRDNDNDGIEVRLHRYEGRTLEIVIRNNEIVDNEGDGIQLIGYPDPSERRFVIEDNLIADNGDAGIGLMDDGETDEDFRGAPLPDPIRVAHNTFVGNRWAMTGGAAVDFAHNAVVDSALGGLRNLTGESLVAYSGFWENAVDTDNVRVGAGIVEADPMLDVDGRPRAASPLRDAGDPGCADPDGSVCDIGRR